MMVEVIGVEGGQIQIDGVDKAPASFEALRGVLEGIYAKAEDVDNCVFFSSSVYDWAVDNNINLEEVH